MLRGSGFRGSKIDLAVHRGSVTTAREDGDAEGVAGVIIGGNNVVATQLGRAWLVGVTDNDGELPLDGAGVLGT